MPIAISLGGGLKVHLRYELLAQAEFDGSVGLLVGLFLHHHMKPRIVQTATQSRMHLSPRSMPSPMS